MTKEEIKQYLRNQIDFSIKIPNKFNNHMVYLCYNKSYLRALKLSKINGKPVNKNDFTCGEKLFCFHTKYNSFLYYPIIRDYLKKNYSNDYKELVGLIEEVLNEYTEYKDYKCI